MNQAEQFISEVNDFIERAKKVESFRNSINCGNCFDLADKYSYERGLVNLIKAGSFPTTKEKGDCLENLIKSLFSRINILQAPKITSCDSNLGQIDIQIIAPDEEIFFSILGIHSERPNGMIGECKNWPASKVGREDIEKICWRTCKGGCLGFFVAFDYTSGAIEEIGEFNLHCRSICCRCERNSMIVPMTIDMISIIVEENINFCYFLQWAIRSSPLMSIRPYLTV
jgi:hypothetical protein